MKKFMTTGAALLLTTSIAQAGGLDRSGQSVGVLFEEGNVVQLSFGSISPEVSGVTTFANPVTLAGPGTSSGNMAESYFQYGAAIKYAYSDQIDLALIFDQPFGANGDYEGSDPGYYTGDVFFDVKSTAITGLARYKVDENISVFGGLRMQTVEAVVEKPFPAGYRIETDPSTAFGFVVGAAYEIPDIALRVALTYNSKITHDIDAVETCIAPDPNCGTDPATSSLDTPESINLDFQTGIAEDTLLFGSIRYAKWTQFDFAPPAHVAVLGGSLQSYDEDTVSYNIGVGRRFNDQFSGAISVGYEAAQGGFVGNLAPTDGNISVGLGGTYAMNEYEITAGLRYIMLGDGDTENPFAAPGSVGSEFRDNSAIGFGMQVSRSF